MLVIVQVSLLVWDQMRVTHAAREAARVLAVTNDPAAATEAGARSGDLDPDLTTFEVTPGDRPAGTPARVSVRYRPSVLVPLVGRFVPPVTLSAAVWIRVERDPP